MHVLNPAYKKVQHINRPLVKGELLWVPCVTGTVYAENPYLDLDPRDHNTEVIMGDKLITITPILWPIHDGHYHADMRFVKTYPNGQVIRKHRSHYFTPHQLMSIRPWEKVEYILLPVIDPDYKNIRLATDLNEILKSEDAIIDVRIKYPGIKKGKCPHKGFNLAQIKPNAQGEIVCPMHGLTFKCKHLQEN